MKQLKIYGASDDLLEVGGIPGADEFYTSGNRYMGYLHVKGEGLHLNIHVIYDGSWAFSVNTQMGDDCDQMPEWKIERLWGTESPYSETLIIHCPDDAIVAYSKP